MIEKILKHLGLWDLKVRPQPKVKAPFVTISIDDSDSQVSSLADKFGVLALTPGRPTHCPIPGSLLPGL